MTNESTNENTNESTGTQHVDGALESLRRKVRAYYPNVRKDRVRLWVDALRSGEYQQTNGTLEKLFGKADGKDGSVTEVKTRNCCLGVACRVAIADGLNLRVSEHDQVPPENWRVFESSKNEDASWRMGPDTAFGANDNSTYLPSEVSEWLGFTYERHESDWHSARTEWRQDENPMVAGYNKIKFKDGRTHTTDDRPRERRLSQWNDTFGWGFEDIANELEATFLVDEYQGAKING